MNVRRVYLCVSIDACEDQKRTLSGYAGASVTGGTVDSAGYQIQVPLIINSFSSHAFDFMCL